MNRISDCGIECKYLRIGYFNVKYIELIYIPINLYKEILYKDIYENIMILRVKMVTSIGEKSITKVNIILSKVANAILI